MQKKWTIVWALTLISGIVGCQQSSTPVADNASATRPPVDGSVYLLTDEPEDAKDVIAVRETAADGEEVLVVGRIGGSENPWIDGRAAFSIVDNSLKACSDIPGDTCEKPWDYCCETPALPSSTALIKVVDQNGELVGRDGKQEAAHRRRHGGCIQHPRHGAHLGKVIAPLARPPDHAQNPARPQRHLDKGARPAAPFRRAVIQRPPQRLGRQNRDQRIRVEKARLRHPRPPITGSCRPMFALKRRRNEAAI